MYRRILVCLENSPTDAYIVEHVRALAEHCGASVVLIHVADGWAARNFDQLKLRESEEMRTDRAYLDTLRAELTARGFIVDTPAAQLALVGGGFQVTVDELRLVRDSERATLLGLMSELLENRR